MQPTISVVIATYNYGRYLAGAIASVLGQTFTDYEVIVVNDGSTDDTESVIRPYLSDSRIRYLRTEHVGQPAAKNAGIRDGTGRYVAFLDADDVWLPTKLEKQVAVFERSDPELGVVYCRRGFIDPDGREFTRDQRTPRRGDVLAPIFHRPFICFSSSVIRRDVLEEVGHFDESIPMSIDYDLWLRIALRYHFDFVDEPLVLYRTGHANLSTRLSERIWCVRKIIYRFLDELGDAIAWTRRSSGWSSPSTAATSPPPPARVVPCSGSTGTCGRWAIGRTTPRPGGNSRWAGASAG